VAIKTILMASSTKETAKDFSVGRARGARRCPLNHPNIVQVTTSAKEGDTAYLVMELIDGKS